IVVSRVAAGFQQPAPERGDDWGCFQSGRLNRSFAERGDRAMLWVGVRYRGIALPDIMKLMQAWLTGRGYRPNTLEYVISGSGTLIRAQLEHEFAETELAEEYAGMVWDDCP